MEGVEDWRGTPNHKFWLATQAGNLNAMRDIVEENKASAEPVNVDVPDPVDGRAAIHLAVGFGNKPMLKWLLQHGASLEADTMMGETPLHVASRAGRSELVLFLIRQGSDVNARSKRGDSPLHVAAQFGWQVSCRYLVENGAHVNSTNDNGDTILHSTARGCFRGYKSGHRDVVEYLLGATSADVNVMNKQRQLAHELATKAHRPKLATLLQTDLDPNPSRYLATNLRRGLAIVIANSVDTTGQSVLPCHVENANVIASTLQGLEFKIVPKRRPMINPSPEEIRAALRKAATTNWNHLDVFVLYYCGIASDTHNITCANGETLSLKSLMAGVGWHQGLTMRRRPKVFVMDTCKVPKLPLQLFSKSKREKKTKTTVMPLGVVDWATKKGLYKEQDEEKQMYTEPDNVVAWCHAPEHVKQPSRTKRATEDAMSRFSWHLVRALRRYSRTMDVVSSMKRLRTDMDMDNSTASAGVKGQRLVIRSFLGKNGEKQVFLRPDAHTKLGNADEESDDDSNTLRGRIGVLSVEEQKEVAAEIAAEKVRSERGHKKKGMFKRMFSRKPKSAAARAFDKKAKKEKDAKRKAAGGSSSVGKRVSKLWQRFRR